MPGVTTAEIVRHRLAGAEQHDSPNVDRRLAAHDVLLYHYAGSRNTAELLGWFMEPRAQASAHLVILRNGAVHQYVPFDMRAWHAGESEWQGRRRVNDFSIGIEMEGDGELVRDEAGWYRPWSGRRWGDQDVVEARHRDGLVAGWTPYTAAQMKAAIEIGRALCREYRISIVLGHDDVSPGRKHDPGPLFPIEMVRRLVLEE